MDLEVSHNSSYHYILAISNRKKKMRAYYSKNKSSSGEYFRPTYFYIIRKMNLQRIMVNDVKIMKYANDTTFLYEVGKAKEKKMLKIEGELAESKCRKNKKNTSACKREAREISHANVLGIRLDH